MAAKEQKPNLQTALAFLQQVKAEMPVEYDTFLDILTQFRSKAVEAENVVSIVLELLVGREFLLKGFSQFLPPSCRNNLLERFGSRLGSKDVKPRQKRPASFESLVGTPPQEPKRKRENVGDMDLRPGALLGPGYSLGKRMSQQHIYQAQLKRDLAPPNITELWQQVSARVEQSVERILADPEGWIPVLDADDIIAGCVDPSVVARIKETGVIKKEHHPNNRYCEQVRRTIPADLAGFMNREITDDINHYLKVEPDKPETYDSIYNEAAPKAFTFGGVQEMYYTRSQLEARQNERLTAVRIWLNGLWRSVEEGTGRPLFLPDAETTYVDRWRHRVPGCKWQTGMKEHIDNGAMCRWADPAWQDVYGPLLQGRLDDYDPWYAGKRTSTAGSFFRSFQGWLALSAQGPGDGGLEVIPMLAEATAYVMLRPFRDDVPAHQFCGAGDGGMVAAGDTLEISGRWHGPLLRAKISVGRVDPGDSVWWHPDLIHGVESLHTGSDPSNVLYVPASPLCPQNARYLVKQREAYLNGGAPPDFPDLALERGSSRRAPVSRLTPLGRRQMGLEPFPEPSTCKEEEAMLAVAAGGGSPEATQEAVELARRRRVLFSECMKILFPAGGGVPVSATRVSTVATRPRGGSTKGRGSGRR